MNADASRLRLHIARGVLTLLALTALTVGLAALLLGASTGDLLLLALFLPFSGGVSLALGLAFLSLYQGRLLQGIRGKLLVAVLLAAGLVLINVGFTAYLMFLSSHDLTLLVLLMLFSMGMASFFALAVSDSFRSRLDLLLLGVRRMGEGELNTHVELSSGDELDELARAFNQMASQLDEAAVMRQEMEDARRHLPAGPSVGEPEVHPATLRRALDKPGLGQQLEMAADAWLALIEDAGEVLHIELAARQQRQQAQARGLGNRLEHGDSDMHSQQCRSCLGLIHGHSI